MCTWKNRKFLKERAMAATGKLSSTLNSSRLGKEQDEANKSARLGTDASPKKADLAGTFDSTIQPSPKKSFKIKGHNTANGSLSPQSKQKAAPFKQLSDLNTLGSRTKGKNQFNKQSFTPGRTPAGAQSVPAQRHTEAEWNDIQEFDETFKGQDTKTNFGTLDKSFL